jgi:hypothetical protein
MSNRSGKASWLPRAATALAVLSCYGTTVLIGLLSLLGVTLAIDEGVWAGAIAIFAALATLAVAVSYRRHRIVGPMVVAALGLGLILWVMFGSYSRVIELVGFVLLIAAALWDWRAGVSRGGTADGISWIEARALADHLKREPEPVIVDVRGPDEFYGPLGLSGQRIEEVFGWIKSQAGLSKVKFRGRARVDAAFTLALVAYNLIRLSKFLAVPT